MPVPKPPEPYTLDSDSESEEASPEYTRPSLNADQDFSTWYTLEPYLTTQAGEYDFV
jgi:hypothetical protein